MVPNEILWAVLEIYPIPCQYVKDCFRDRSRKDVEIAPPKRGENVFMKTRSQDGSLTRGLTEDESGLKSPQNLARSVSAGHLWKYGVRLLESEYGEC